LYPVNSLSRTIRSQESPPVYFTPEYTPSDRRNIFDNDAFDLKQVSPTQIHRGHKNRATATDLLNTSLKFMQSAKSRILATQWDEYEDEYVDTYDEPPQPNTQRGRLRGIRDDVDEETTESEAEEDVERVVYAAFKRTPQVFERGARRSKEREALKVETKWSDEQIEGWKSIAERDPAVLKRLEERELESVVQTALPSTAWRAPKCVAESEEEGEVAGGVRGRGGAPGREGGSSRGGSAGAGGGKGKSRGRGGRGRGVDRGRAKKGRIRAEFRPDAQ
jgi:activating signal cointegrator complex subunit 2